MPGLDPGIYAFLSICQDVDGRDEPGHDDAERCCPAPRLKFGTLALDGQDLDYARFCKISSSVFRNFCLS